MLRHAVLAAAGTTSVDAAASSCRCAPPGSALPDVERGVGSMKHFKESCAVSAGWKGRHTQRADHASMHAVLCPLRQGSPHLCFVMDGVQRLLKHRPGVAQYAAEAWGAQRVSGCILINVHTIMRAQHVGSFFTAARHGMAPTQAEACTQPCVSCKFKTSVERARCALACAQVGAGLPPHLKRWLPSSASKT